MDAYLSKMTSLSGLNVAAISAKHRVSLTFVKWLGCPLCVRDMDEIAGYMLTFLRLNTIPMICCQETKEDAQKIYDQMKQRDPLLGELIIVPGVTKELQEAFGIKNASIGMHLQVVPDMLPLMNNFSLPSKTVHSPLIMFGLALVENGKVIKRFTFKSLKTRPNYGSFLLEIEYKQQNNMDHIDDIMKMFPNIVKATKAHKQAKLAGVQKAPELTVQAVMDDKAKRKLFKMHVTNEYSVENILFIEEVERYLATKGTNEKIKAATSIITNFLQETSFNEINVNTKVKQSIVNGLLEKGPVDDLFSATVNELMAGVLSDSFARFKHTELYKSML